MASLKEIKGRIASVANTLKITSAMKLVASAKLHKAQQAIGNMLPYQKQLYRILMDLMATAGSEGTGLQPDSGGLMASRPVGKVAIVAFSSNSSLCGAFNSNVVKQVLAVVAEYRSQGLSDSDITVYSVGRKMADAMRKTGFRSPADYSRMAENPSYEAAAALAQELLDGFRDGRFDKVELVYNHYKSTASQPTLRQTYLPMTLSDANPEISLKRPEVSEAEIPHPRNPEDLLIEPSVDELIGVLLPKVVRLRIYTTLLDSNAAEHAARTVALQTATDNGNDLLAELTLEYNKGRQQKITSEILDIVGGTLQ